MIAFQVRVSIVFLSLIATVECNGGFIQYDVQKEDLFQPYSLSFRIIEYVFILAINI